ncbi:calponin homology domain-containing protein DDB_G0272472-like [Mercenaria mercenaria]|uniref:calponin homology domain-containing protein DDB_G0272472-like n=1 Tax=Mercenaria mercenaria TaxID=6596 RepID=UPI00234EEF3D|nr:calponin homology domain-containing protein DDB_G0272472-like [Mercenaria mercenaria]
MKCSNSTCGAEGPGKFCQECGSKMVEEIKTDLVVICNGKLDDGSPCQSELVFGQKFCMSCGTRVDQTLFTILQEKCCKCNTPLLPGKLFCAECGQRQSKQSQASVVEKELDVIERSRREPTAGESSSMETDVIIDKKSEEVEGTDSATINKVTCGTGSACEAMTSSEQNQGEPFNLDQKSIQTNASDKRPLVQTEGGDKPVNQDNTSTISEEKMKESIETQTTESETIYISSDSDIEMIDVSIDEEAKVDDDKSVKNQGGNLIIIPSNPNKELSAKFEQVKLESTQKGNINIIDDSAKKAVESEGSGTSESEGDSQSQNEEDLLSSLSTSDTQEMGSGQTKRIKKQKKNKKKMRKERETKHEQTETETENTASTASKEKNNIEKIVDEEKVTSEKGHIVSKTDTKSSGSGSLESQFVFGGGSRWGINEKSDAVENPAAVGDSLFKLDKRDRTASPSGRKEQSQSDSKDQNRPETENEKNIKDSGKNNADVKDEKELAEDDDVEMEEDKNSNDEESNLNKREGVLTRRQKKNLKKKEEKEKEANEKSKKDNDNAERSKKTKQSGSTPGTNGSGGRSEKYTHVFFHVLINEDFKFNSEKHRLILAMEDQHEKWENMSRVCKIKK